ncbi:hypothetical protein RB195_018877 [Necator americanus]|uniref:Uncharacterized protein n=1 Tax=Necator americanus TaxID=51031 RepID=A0ABR1CCU5_NECAM
MKNEQRSKTPHTVGLLAVNKGISTSKTSRLTTYRRSFTLKLPCLLFSSFKVFYTVFSFLCWTDLTDCFCKLITLVKFKKKNVPTTNSCIQIV